MPNNFDVLNRQNVLGKSGAGLDGLMQSMTGQGQPTPEPQIVEVEVVPENAIVRRDDGAMVYKRFVMTATGLEIPEGCQRPEWEDVGGFIKSVDSALSWWVGDFAEYATKHLEMTYEQVAQWLGSKYNLNTIEFYASVCRGVDGLVRNYAVSLSHSAKIAMMDEGMQRRWLNYIVARPAITVAQLAEDIRLLRPFGQDDQIAWLQWIEDSPAFRLADVEELKPPSATAPTLPVAVTEGREIATKRLGKLAAYVQGKRVLTPEQVRQEGQAIIEWVQWLMEASE